MIDYDAIASAGGIPKPARSNREAVREINPKASVTKKKPKKSRIIPKAVKEATLEKSRFCYVGLCPYCGGKRVTVHDDFDHYPARSQGGRDIPEHGWMARHECHMESHANPKQRKEMFGAVEAAGYPVDWGAKI
ncbi:MAG TPA: hypothetical protein DD734_03845, partial [Firmicutes bacterium]|nr:hypothetical protein [Bacillota bacterium]